MAQKKVSVASLTIIRELVHLMFTCTFNVYDLFFGSLLEQNTSWTGVELLMLNC